MATSDEQDRAGAPRIDFEMRFYVGGKWTEAELDNIEAGQPFTPTVATTLAEDVDATETDIDVVDASSLTTGVVVIIPTDATQQYELVKYTSIVGDTLTGCTRTLLAGPEPSNPFSYLHLSGDAVVEWVEITDYVLDGHDSEQLLDGVITWSVSVHGIGYNSVLMDNDNAMLCMARWRPGAGGSFTLWTDWAVYWLGFIKEVRLSDDADEANEWTATVEPWYQYLETTDADPVTYGFVDLAADKSVQVSSVLEDPYTETGNGEFIGSPDCEGEDAVDGDMGTLWISEEVPLADYAGVATGSHIRINEMYLRPAPGLPSGLQWIEIVFTWDEGATINLKDYHLVNNETTWTLLDSSCEGNPNCLPQYATTNTNYIALPDCEMSPGDFVILTSDKPAFIQHWGETGAVQVIDWRHHVRGTFTLSATSGKLGLMWYGMSNSDDVFWGSESKAYWYYIVGDESIVYSANYLWQGANLPAMDNTECPEGYSYHRYPDAEHADTSNFINNWDINVSTPVYADKIPTPGEMARSDAPEWIAVDLGETGITLQEALSGGGGETYVLLSATLGLTESGRIVIDYEYIDYTTRDDVNNKLLGITRAVGGTSLAAHIVDTPVYQREDDVTYKCHLVTHVGWRRRNAIGTEPPVPKIFSFYFSSLDSPILPDDEDWEDTWEDYWPMGQAIHVSDYSAAGSTNVAFARTFDPIRARWVLLTIDEMTDAGRAKLNELRVYAPAQESAGDITFSGGVLKDALVTRFGIPAANLTLTDPGTTFISLSLTKQSYSSVLSDLMVRTGCILIFNRDNTIEHQYDPRLPIGTLPDIEIDWDRTNARSIELTRPFRHGCRQLILRATEPHLDDVFEVTWPPTPLRLGTIEQVDDVMAGSLDQAIVRAQLMFKRRNGLLVASVSVVGLGEFIRAGQRHTVTWEMDSEGTYVQGRNFVVASVQRVWSFGDKVTDPSWTCSLELEELVF